MAKSRYPARRWLRINSSNGQIAEGAPIDDTNRRLLAELQADARLSLAELGRRVGLSSPAVAERLQRLEHAGVIRGYRRRRGPARARLSLTVGDPDPPRAARDGEGRRPRAAHAGGRGVPAGSPATTATSCAPTCATWSTSRRSSTASWRTGRPPRRSCSRHRCRGAGWHCASPRQSRSGRHPRVTPRASSWPGGRRFCSWGCHGDQTPGSCPGHLGSPRSPVANTGWSPAAS